MASRLSKIISIFILLCTAFNFALPVAQGESPTLPTESEYLTHQTDHVQFVDQSTASRVSPDVASTPYFSNYLKASNTKEGHAFGSSVAIDGDTLVIGAPNEDGSSSNTTNNTGGVYVFIRQGASWTQQAILHSSPEYSAQYLGTKVAISGDTIVAWGPTPAAMTGAVYIFTRTGTTWSQQARLTPAVLSSGDAFGGSIAIEGDILVIGAPQEDSENLDPNNNSATNAGSAYIFTRQDNLWTQQAYLKAPVIEEWDYFGSSVSISEGTVVVGAQDIYVSGGGIESIGAAHVFVQDGPGWSLQATLAASNGEDNDRFGSSIDISGDICVVGAPFEDSSAIGVEGDQFNNDEEDSGAAYVFVRNGSSWIQSAYLKASNTKSEANFGSVVSISGDSIVIGAPYEGNDATGDSGTMIAAGAVYHYKYNRGWEIKYIKATNIDRYDQFGSSVDIQNDRIIVGAPGESSNATGVNGDQSNNTAQASGAGYIFFENPMLEIVHIEFNQSVQDEENSVKLIAGKPLSVSVFVRTLTGEDRSITGEITLIDPVTGARLYVIKPDYWSITINDVWSEKYLNTFDLRDKHAMDFYIPSTVTRDLTQLFVEVNIQGIVETRLLEFETEKYLSVLVVPVDFNGDTPSLNYIDIGMSNMEAMFPLTNILTFESAEHLKWVEPLISIKLNNLVDLTIKLSKYRDFDDRQYDYVVGILPMSLRSHLPDFAGVSHILFPVAMIFEIYTYDDTVAHEVGHLMGQPHVIHDSNDCLSGCSSTSCSPAPDPRNLWVWWPYDNPGIQNTGFDSISKTIIVPNFTDDIMSYCNSLWVSPFRYNNLLDKAESLNRTRSIVDQTRIIPSLIVSGIVYTNDSAQLDPVWIKVGEPGWENPPLGSEYCLQSLDSGSILLNEVCFNLDFLTPETFEPSDVDIFNVHIPYSDSISRLKLVEGSTVLVDLPVSANSPEVQLISPAGGETLGAADLLNISWTGSDLDGDTLYYNVFYSPDDGLTWSPLAIDLQESSVEINTSRLPGSLAGKIKVEVTDGINTSYDINDAPFSVSGKAPKATIKSPLDDQLFVSGGPIPLYGSGFDLEDGYLPGMALCWSSDLDGFLGCAESITPILSTGLQVITLEVEDSQGLSGTAQVTVDVQDCFLLVTNEIPKSGGLISTSISPNCEADPVLYANGTEVQLSVLPNPGYTFLEWADGTEGVELPKTINISSNLRVSAIFKQTTFFYYLPIVIR